MGVLTAEGARAQAASTAAPSGSGAADANSAVQEVVVTGSRVMRSTFTAPNPLTVISQQDIQKLNLTNVGDIIGELPQNSNFFAGNNVGLGNFNVGAQLANLRGLNPFFGTRTLTMLDTQRVVPTTTGGGVDVTLIPSMLVGRTETVTGGASAVYGSDAVAGVVNIILDTKLQGFKATADYGQTTYGDGGDYHASAAFGDGFAGGRGHFVIGGEFEHSEAIGICSQLRSWCATNYAEYTNTNYNTPGAPGYGQPHYVLGNGGTAANESRTGVLAPCLPVPGVCVSPAPQMQFNASGSALVPYTPGLYSAGAGFFGSQQGGDPNSVGAYDTTTMRPDVRKYSVLGHADYDITPSITGSIEGWFARSNAVNPVANGAIGPYSLQVAAAPNVYVGNPITADNAYLTPAEATFVTGLHSGVAEFGRNMLDTVTARNETNDSTYRFVASLKGDLGHSWGWDGYGEFGLNQNDQHLYHNVVSSFLDYGLDAVKNSSGQIVCGVTIPGHINPNTGAPYSATDVAAAGSCTPLNLFGAGNASQAAIDYAFRTLQEYSSYYQDVVSGNLHGDLFSGFGAGPVKLAAGAEYRHEYATVTHDLPDQPFYNSYLLSYGLDYRGSVDVMEGYGELNIPLVKDAPLVKYAELDGAFRETSNTAHNQTTEPAPFVAPADAGQSRTNTFDSWKVSGIWDLTDWFRIRGTRSRDVRAAQFRELFQSYAVAAGGPFGSINNPWHSGISQPAFITTGGNLALKPELADTTTVGFVLSPKSGPLNRLRLSADWYQIVINDPIAGPPFGIGAQNIVAECFQGVQSFCGLMTRDANNNVLTVNNTAENLGAYTTRGIDYELGYTLPLDEVNPKIPGDLSFRVLASYLYDMIINAGLGAAPINYAGQSGPTGAFGGFNTSPYWQGNMFLTYTTGPFSGTAQVRYVGAGRFATINADGSMPLAPGAANYATTAIGSITNNQVPSAYYINLAGSYDINKHWAVFANIDNLLNRAPPMAPGGNGYPTNPVYFDTYGMAWKLGMRARF
jgi:outer membrane receptor protein involved in Fe transport